MEQPVSVVLLLERRACVADALIPFVGDGHRSELTTVSELLRLIEVGASCFNHYCVGRDVTQLNVLHNVHRRMSSGYSIPTICILFMLLH